MANMAFRGTPKQERELRRFIRKHKDQPGALMPVLQEAQGIYGYLPKEVQQIIAEIACAERLYALRQTAEADALSDSIRAKIAATDMKDWQRDRLLHALSKVSRYSQTV